MIPKKIIRLSMILSIMLGGIFASCSYEIIENMPLPKGSNDAAVTFSLSVPGSSVPSTRGLSEQDETNVETIDVLLFNEISNERVYYGQVQGMMLDNSPGNTKSFKAMISVSEYDNYDITVIANGREQIMDAELVVGASKAATLNKLVKTIPAGEKWESNKIPMWGEALDVTVGSDTNLSGENAVRMTRMISRIDVKLSKKAATGSDDKEATGYDNFELVSVRLYNYSTNGTLAPDIVNGWIAGDAATKPEATAPNKPADGYGKALFGDGNQPLVYEAADEHTSALHIPDSLIRAIYTLEAPKGSSGALETNTCLVIGGKYQGGADETYYRIDFVVKNQKSLEYEYIPLLRNFLYVVNIVKISGEGFDSPEKAFHSRPVNIETEILEWNDAFLSDVVFDGQNYLSVSQSMFEFHRDAREVGRDYEDNILYVKTDYASKTAGVNSGWYIEKTVDANDRSIGVDWLTLTPSSGAPKQQNMPADEIRLTFEENTDTEKRSAIVVIAAGRLRYELEVRQSTKPEIMLNIVDPDTALPVNELVFNSLLGQDPLPQKFRVDWRPEDADLRITSAAMAANPFPDGVGAPENGLISGGSNGTGTIVYTIQPKGLTAEDIADDPFFERSSKVDFTVSNGASYESESIFLRQIHYNLLVDYAGRYLPNGNTYSMYVRSNTAWRVKSITGSGSGMQLLALKESDNLRKGVTGGYDTSGGDELTFTVSGNEDLWGSIEVTFESTESPKKFADKTVKLQFPYPRVTLMGIGVSDSYCLNPALSSGSNSSRSANTMLQSPSCFGIDPASVVYCRGIDFIGYDVSTGISDANLKTYLDQQPDILFVSYNVYITEAQVPMYMNYLNNGGVMVALYERDGSSRGAHFLLQGIFGEAGAGITSDLINASGAVYQVDDTVDDMITNGPFGDVRGLYWGEDRSTTGAVKGIPTSEAVIYSNGYDWSYRSPGYADMVTALRHNKYNFIWIGDGGFLACNSTSSETSSPFVFDSELQMPVPKQSYGRYSGLYKPVYNSLIFGNIMAWAIEQANNN